jgi:hypothetical protein
MTAPATSLIPIVVNGHCLGHLIGRRSGFEAFSRDDQSLGLFPTAKAAANAVIDSASNEGARDDF